MGVGLNALKLLGNGVLVVCLLSLVRCGPDEATLAADVREEYLPAQFSEAPVLFATIKPFSCAAVVFRAEMDAAVLAGLPDVQIGPIKDRVDEMSIVYRIFGNAGEDCALVAPEGMALRGVWDYLTAEGVYFRQFGGQILIYDPAYGVIVSLAG